MELVKDEVVIEEPAPIDFNWVEETEEVSNCDDIILEQDIPASLEEEVVTNSGTEADDDNSDIQTASGYTSIYVDQMPKSKILLRKNYMDKSKQVCAGRPMAKFKQTLFVNRNLLKLNQYKFNTNQLAGTSLLKPIFQAQSSNPVIEKKNKEPPPGKFKQSAKGIRNNLKKRKERSYDRQSTKSSSSESSSEKQNKKKFVDLHGENITINHDIESGDHVSIKNETSLQPLTIPQNAVSYKVVAIFVYFINMIFTSRLKSKMNRNQTLRSILSQMFQLHYPVNR